MKQNKSLLIELHYFPSIPCFSKFFLYPKTILEQQENYVKRSYRNRMHIASANGLLRLSVPLQKGKNKQQAIRAVKISYEEPWQNKQWTAICSAYGNAPFFEYYADDFRPLFEERTIYLFDFNLKILNTLFFVLDMQPNIELSSTYLKETLGEVADFREKIKPNGTLEAVNIAYQIIPYQQVFSEKNGFLPNLSILDLIFCKGPEAVSILQQSTINFE